MLKRVVLSLVLCGSAFVFWAQGNQCPGCAINLTCTGTQPTLCPAALPNGMQGVYYDQDLTFFLPQTFTDAGSGTQVTLQQIVVNGITGMPQGLFWTTNSANNTYVVTSDPNTQRGCAKVCGTPSIPGTFNATVSVTATVNTIIGVQSVPQSFVLPLVIDPAPGGNPYFSYSPAVGCGSATVDFEGLLNLGLPQITEYQWTFGNGNTSTAQFPPLQTYSTPGSYYPSLTTNVFDHALNSLTALITGGWFCGDIEELFCGSGGADLQFTMTHGGGSFISPTIDNNMNPTWNNLGVALASLSIGIQFTEVDGGPPFGSPSDNGGSFSFVVPGPGTYNFSTSAVTFGGGGVSGNFTIIKQLFNAYTATDTVVVYALPPVTGIQSSTGSMTMCSTQPITLSVYPGYSYEWFRDDTVLLVGNNTHEYVVPDPGFYPYVANYKVKIMDTLSGCATITQNVTVTVNEGIPELFPNSGAVYVGGQLTSYYSGFETYQWLLNGLPLLPGGLNQTITPSVNGSYSLVMTNSVGCSDTSNIVLVFDLENESWEVNEESFTVFPNPSDGLFTLRLSDPHVKSAQFSLCDIAGKSVHSGWLTQAEQQVDLSHLPAGVYTLSLRIDNRFLRRKVVIR
jgi:hypothetical protein